MAVAFSLTLLFVRRDGEVGIGVLGLSFCCFVVHTNVLLDPLAFKVFDDVPIKGLTVIFNVTNICFSLVFLKGGLEALTFLDFTPKAVGYPCSFLFMVGKPMTPAIGVEFPLDVAEILHVLP